MTDIFRDRKEAGQRLATELIQYANREDVIIFALPRGGVPVGYEIATALQLPLDVILVRKLGVPGQEELAMGAIAMENIAVYNRDIIEQLHISQDAINHVKQQQQAILEERNVKYRGSRPFPNTKDMIVLLVDDGVATGATMRTAIAVLQHLKYARLIVAVPVAPESTVNDFQKIVDEVVCLEMPEPFYAIGNWYQEFSQTTDDEVIDLLARARNNISSRGKNE